LLTVADVLFKLGLLEGIGNRLPEAHAFAQESLAIYRRFNVQNPRAFTKAIEDCEKLLAIIAEQSAGKKAN
jgi:hypothetical protein